MLRAQRAVRALARPGRRARRAARPRRGDARTAPRRGSTTAACSRPTSSCGRAAPGSAGCSPSTSRSAPRARSCSSSTAARPGRAPGVPAFVDFEQAIYGTRDIDGLGVKAAPDFDGPRARPRRRAAAGDRRGRGDRAALPRRALPRPRARAAQRLEVLPLRALARRALRRRAASRAPVRLAARRRLGPRLQARPRARRAGRRGARRHGAAAGALRTLRPRPGQPPEDGWRGALSRRSVGSMHDYLIVGAGSAGCALAARLTEDPGVSVLLVEAGPPDSEQAVHIPVDVLAALPHAARLGLQLGAGARASAGARSTCRAGACWAGRRR